MFGNIWLSSALVVTAIFSASALYNSYSDIQEAKQIQEHYEIISEIKTLLAKQYNKEPDEITRDEIIVHLPKGENWEKVLLLDRNKDSNLSNKELVNSNGDFELSQDEKLKLLALKAKLKNIIDVNAITPVNGKYTFDVGDNNKNEIIKDIQIQNAIKKAILYMINRIIYENKTTYSNELTATLTNFTPYDYIYQDLRTAGEITSDTILSETELEARKKNYFKSKLKEQLLKNENSEESRLYYLMKDVL
jgi:hypothetical protein